VYDGGSGDVLVMMMTVEMCHCAGVQEMQCRNHIRAVFQVVNSQEYCVCGTGAHSPQEQFLTVRPLPCLYFSTYVRVKCS